MIINAVQIGTKLATMAGVTNSMTTVMSKLIPEGADVATKIGFRVTTFGISAIIADHINESVEKLLDEIGNVGVTVENRKRINQSIKNRREELMKAESEEEILSIIEGANDELMYLKKELEIVKKYKKEKKGNDIYLKKLNKEASKKLKEVEDRK